MRLPLIFTLLVSFSMLQGCSVQPRFSNAVWDDSSVRIDQFYRGWQGAPYRLGGSSKRGVDCSAFVQRLYGDVYGLPLPRTTVDQAESGYSVLPGELEPGDLVFFKTGWKTRHVGVYIGSGEFVHASTSQGVTRSSLHNPYWTDNFWKAKRVF